MSSGDQKQVSHELQAVYKATSLLAAQTKLEAFKSQWEEKYPLVVESWQRNWTRLMRFYDYPPAIGKVIYTTNTVEGFHGQLGQLTKTKSVFASEMALVKLLYLVSARISEKWTMPLANMPLANWALTLQQLSILFGERIKRHLKT